MLHPLVVQEMAIVEASSTSWMALAVLKSGNDRRFRFQGGKLLDESVIGDARAA